MVFNIKSLVLYKKPHTFANDKYSVQEALNADLDKYREKLKENKHFKVNKMEAARQGLTVRQAVAKANSERISKRKEQEYKELSKKYNPQLSVRKNAELLGVSTWVIQNLKKWIND